MMSGNDDLVVYTFQGKRGEKVPFNVDQLIVKHGVQVLPNILCTTHERLRQVTFPVGLQKIGDSAFSSCANLLEIEICSTVQFIGKKAFFDCTRLKNIKFEDKARAPHQLQTIEVRAFQHCHSLQRTKLPSLVNTVGAGVFAICFALMEANLSKTCIAEISEWAFAYCHKLQTVCLPGTLERICENAFYECNELVTVVVPLVSKPIRIGIRSFCYCQCLANLALPRDSAGADSSFLGSFLHCAALNARFGEDSADIVTGLMGRFASLSVHKMCYRHSGITALELRQCIEEQEELEYRFVDEFGMTPFHIFFSTAEPSLEMLQVLLDHYGSFFYQEMILNRRDTNGKRPLDYLFNNWSDGTPELLQRTLQTCMFDRLLNWGAQLWVGEMRTKVEAVLSEHYNERKVSLFNDLYSDFVHFENVESTSILEIALWKEKLKSEWSNNTGSKPQALVDREECRCLCGSNVVIPNVIAFLHGT